MSPQIGAKLPLLAMIAREIDEELQQTTDVLQESELPQDSSSCAEQLDIPAQMVVAIVEAEQTREVVIGESDKQSAPSNERCAPSNERSESTLAKAINEWREQAAVMRQVGRRKTSSPSLPVAPLSLSRFARVCLPRRVAGVTSRPSTRVADHTERAAMDINFL